MVQILRSMKRNRIKNYLTQLVKLSIGALVITWLISSGRLDVKELISLFKPQHLVILLGITVTNLVLNNYRWLLLLRSQGFKVNFESTLKLTFIGLFFNLVIPGGVGGDVVKGYYLIKDNKDRKMAAAASIFLDRVLGVVAMVLLTLFSVVVNFSFIMQRKELISLAGITSLLFIGICLFFYLSVSEKFYHSIQKIISKLPGSSKFLSLQNVLYSYRHSMGTLFKACLLSFVAQLVGLSFFIYVGYSLGYTDVSIWAYLFVVPLGMIVTAVPISPAGIGVGQAALLVLFDMYLGYHTSLGPVSITAYQMVMIMWGLFGSIFYFRGPKPQVVEELA